MKTSIRNKKGFTIVELVIVIAVIAILAAVLIPTFANLVEKANQSADIQAVRQMNTYLAIDEIDSNKTISDAHRALEAGGMSAENYTPLQSGTYFYWIKELNRIVYVGSDDKVIFPEEYKGQEVTDGWYVLNGVITATPVALDNSGVATVTTSGELYWLSENMPDDLKEIKITADTLDMHGADISFVVKRDLKITGKEGGTTIKGAVSLEGRAAQDGKIYGAGFVAFVAKNANLTISNITIEDGTFGGYEIGGVGALIGKINGQGTNDTVTITNCQVINSVINGKNKIGALIGSSGAATIKIKECKVDQCTVNCSEGESGMAIGCVYNNGLDLTIDKAFDKWVTNTTLNLVSTDKRDVIDATSISYKHEDETLTAAGFTKIIRQVKEGKQVFEDADGNEYYEKADNNLPSYRMFASNAYMTAVKTAANWGDVKLTISIGSQDEGFTVSKKDDGSIFTEKKVNEIEMAINILEFFK